MTSSVIGIAAGMTLLAIALVTRNDNDFVSWTGYWLGGILVVVGTGKLFFLDER